MTKPCNKYRKLIFLFSLLVFIITTSPVMGQYYFGRNKVQYTDFDWQVIETKHFRIYFYREEVEVARLAAGIAEDMYDSLSIKFNHEVAKSIPLIVYSASSYFSQTNILPSLIPESVGGFTEFLKGRVAVPFHGSYFEFYHVIKHELVHVFTFSKIDAVISRQSRLRFPYPPLWFIEGLAEYWSEGWDTDADMFIKDMVLNDRLLPVSHLYVYNNSYFIYKLGQSLCAFIDEYYGGDKLLLLFENWHKGRNFEDLIKLTLGDDINEMSRKWQYYLKKKYFPELAQLDLPRMESEPLTRGGFAVKGVPIHWDDGHGTTDWIVYKANRQGYSGLYMKPRNRKDGEIKTLLKGERSAQFESLYLNRSGIDANDSGIVVFVSKFKETDVIYIYNLNNGKVTDQFKFEDMAAIRSPRLSPVGTEVVFSGVKKNGLADLYLLNITSGKYRAITNDIYYDCDPAFSIDGKEVFFVSERGQLGAQGILNIFKLNLFTRVITQLTFGPYSDQTPEPSVSGVYFSSDREGTFNLYHLDNNGILTRQSTFVTGVFDPRLTSDGQYLIYTGYEDMSYQVYQMKINDKAEMVTQPDTADLTVWSPRMIDLDFNKSSIKYKPDFSFDIAQSSIAYDPVYGSIGGVQAAVSDMLGNHAFYFLLADNADTKDEFFSSLNVGITYINKEKRLNWGLGLFHLFDEYYNDYDQYYDERQAGLLTLVSYPLSKFQRLEFSTYARYDSKDRRYGLTDREGFLMTNYIRWVYDNSIWDISGPIDGRRYNLSLGLTNSISDTRNYNRLAMVDIRHYVRLGQYSAFANRMFAYTSAGIEPQRIYLGGSWSFRGFDRRAFYNRNVLFVSNEIRFPLIDDLLIDFPIGGLGFRGIRGALFCDAGSAWDNEFDQFYGSFGAGFRVSLGYVVLLRFDFSRTTDFETISPRTDFDFFFGWNF